MTLLRHDLHELPRHARLESMSHLLCWSTVFTHDLNTVYDDRNPTHLLMLTDHMLANLMCSMLLHICAHGGMLIVDIGKGDSGHCSH